MGRNYLFIGFILTILMSSCASLNKSPSELVKTASTKESYCYSPDSKVIIKRIYDHLERCHTTFRQRPHFDGQTPQFGGQTQKMSLIQENIKGGSRLSLSNFFGTGYSVEIIKGSDSCNAEVNMYAVSFFWKSTFKLIDRAAKGEYIKCPG